MTPSPKECVLHPFGLRCPMCRCCDGVPSVCSPVCHLPSPVRGDPAFVCSCVRHQVLGTPHPCPGELKATFRTGLDVLQCSGTVMSSARSPVTRGRSVAEYPLLHAPPPPLFKRMSARAASALDLIWPCAMSHPAECSPCVWPPPPPAGGGVPWWDANEHLQR